MRHGRAGALGVEHGLQHQPRVVGLAVGVELRPSSPAARSEGGASNSSGLGSGARRRWAPERERVVERDAGAEGAQARPLAAVGGEQELDRAAEVRRDRIRRRRSDSPSNTSASRRTGDSEGRRGSAATTGSTSGRRSRPPRRARPSAPQHRVARDAGAGRAAAHDQKVDLFVAKPAQRRLRRAGARGGRPGVILSAMCSSSSWRRATGPGASVMRSVPFCVFGNAITSRSDSAPHRSIARRSTPAAMPPCGGGPYLNASSRKPNLACASSSERPSARKTRACTSGRWMRIEPPAISLPLSTRS